MELWIRSQDKLILTRVNEININYKEPTKIISNHYLYGEQHENYIFLGEYATKERALEVLDEIQDILQDETVETETIYIGNQEYEKTVTRKPNIPKEKVVYEMPKE